jgi:hypothetical protein
MSDLSIDPAHIETETYGDGEAWTKWYVFEPPLTQEKIQAILNELSENYYYGGPGRRFVSKAWLRSETPESTVITQSGGWDI